MGGDEAIDPSGHYRSNAAVLSFVLPIQSYQCHSECWVSI